MSVSHSVIMDIKQWLSNQYIIVSNEWVKACAEFLQEFHGRNMPIQQFKKCVYEQWLNADLEEIGIGTLPPDLCSAQKIVLPGTYALQVVGMRDISRPAYSQLKQLEGSLNADVDVSAAPKVAQPEWEAKPSRVLLLNLTDGINFVQAMEYKSISALSLNILPGTKVLIKGPVNCGLGIMLLSPEKIKVLGGDVESLLQKYSHEMILREVLQRPTNDDENDNLQQMESAVVDRVIPSNSNNEMTPRVLASSVNNRSLFASRNSVSHAQNQNINRPNALNLNLQSNDDEDDFDDDFSDDIDYEAIAELERLSGQEQQDQPSLSEGNTSGSHSSRGSQQVTEDEEMLQHAFENIDDIDPFEAMKNPLFDMDELPLKKSENAFTYLNVITEKGISSLETSVTVKGFISKVLSRLQCTPNKEWQLMAKISDDTGSIEADFHDKVLEEIVGISAEDMMNMQLQARENTSVKSKIMEAVANCKKKLQELNCLMEIQFKPNKKPCVIKCLQFKS